MQKQVYVSLIGCDNNEGSVSSPVKTIQKAIDIVVKNGCEENEILLNSGIYNIEKTIEITEGMPKTVFKPLNGADVKIC
ncbi:MAG: hypothetical protein K0S55_994, partial [Clostridia bacterium]|nr:hypothetical protein [Clostridia bacterium]